MIESFIKNQDKVLVYIVNGYCMEGVIVDKLDDCIVMQNGSVVFFHAISTIKPV